MNITFTVNGSGGTSGPIAGFANHGFCFIDDGGNVPFDALAPYGITASGFPGQASTGSYAISSSIHLTTHHPLQIAFSYLTNTAPHYDYGACYLVKNGHANPQPLFSPYDGEPNQDLLNLIPPAAGVTLSPSSVAFLSNTVLLNGVTYGPQRRDEALDQFLPGGSIPWVTSSYTVAADGDYQLLFLVWNSQSPARLAALAVSSIKAGGKELLSC